MIVWVFKDAIDGTYDICQEFTDSVGPEFVEADLPEKFTLDFAQAQVRYWGFVEMLESIWLAGQKKKESK